MKRRFMSLLCLSLLSLLCAFVFDVTAASSDSITVKVGIYENSPKIFTDEKGNASGFWPDIIQYIASQEGWKVEYVNGTWNECLQRLQNNEIDIMPDVAYTDARAKIYDFSKEPVYTSWSLVYTKKGAHISTILDLKGKNIAVMKGSVNYQGTNGIKELVSSFGISCSFTEVDSYQKVFELVASGEADGGVVSKDFGHVNENKFKLEKTPIVFQPAFLYFAVPKGASLNLLDRVDFHVKQIKEEGDSVYYQSLEKWFGTARTEKHVTPVWLIWPFVGIGGLALLLIGGNFILRSQVNSKTKELTQEITERKRAEEELKKHREHLEDLVKERTAELSRANEQLSFANKELESFAYSVSHDLRAPLRAIDGFSLALLEDYEKSLDQQGKDYLGRVRAATQRMARLIDDILRLSRVIRKEMTIEKVNLSNMVRTIVGELQKASPQRKVDLIITEGINVYGDSALLETAMQNLLDNAWKFTGKKELGRIEFGITNKDGKTVYFIRDNGVGFEMKYVDKLFGTFQRLHSIEEFPGTGIGLATVQRIFHRHQGHVWAEGVVGEGAVFYFTLPDYDGKSLI